MDLVILLFIGGALLVFWLFYVVFFWIPLSKAGREREEAEIRRERERREGNGPRA